MNRKHGRICILFLSSMVLSLLAGCITAYVPERMRLFVSVGKPVLISKSNESHGWGFLSHPFIWDVQPNGVVVNYNLSGDVMGAGTLPASLKDKGPAVSLDGGKNWLLGEKGLSSLPSGYVPGGNEYSCIKLDHGFFSWGVVFSRKGELTHTALGSWLGDEGPVTTNYEGYMPEIGKDIYLSDQCVKLPNGDLFIVGYTANTNDPGSTCVVALSSRDEGHHWQYLSTVATRKEAPWGLQWPIGFEGPSEPAITYLPGDELLCVMRTGVKQKNQWEPATGALRMLQARSRDGGVTWNYKCLPIEGVCPKLCQMSNGVLAMAFGRPGNNLVFSLNEGRTWGYETAITPADVRTSGYIDLVEIEPGRLLVVYDAYNTDVSGFWLWEPQEVNGVFSVFVDVKRLW